ncbi:MAG: class I SAM-dependent methyltransferase [Clostridiales Family XIII bacterium]|jgi:ubiquinone/menaquinone biosynthesis C-methylase UbiE|nr:class I SAM-dependent methyltransferase [Clostridiales Family XIII bacterium]
MGLMRYVGGQLHKPAGVGGRLVMFVASRQNDRQYRETESALGLRDGDAVLDIGFGNGYLLRRLAGNHGSRFYGVDVSEDMLRVAGRSCRRHIREGRVALSLGDASRTGFPDGFFDKAYTVNTVYFWPDLGEGFAEAFRVLKPGGLFVNAFYAKDFLDTLPVARRGYAKRPTERLVEAGEAAGFAVSERATLAGKACCLICQKQEG